MRVTRCPHFRTLKPPIGGTWWKVGMREGRYGSLGTFSQRSVDSVSGQAESASDLGRWPPPLRTPLSFGSVDTGSDVWTPGTLPSPALRSVPHVRPAGPDRMTPSTQACVGPQGRLPATRPSQSEHDEGRPIA